MADHHRDAADAEDLQFRERRQRSHTLGDDVVRGLREMAAEARRGIVPVGLAERLEAAAVALVDIRAEAVNGLEREGRLRGDLRRANTARDEVILEMRALRKEVEELEQASDVPKFR